jgi:hypothetical protein
MEEKGTLKTAMSVTTKQALSIESIAKSADIINPESSIQETENLKTELPAKVKQANLIEPNHNQQI